MSATAFHHLTQGAAHSQVLSQISDDVALVESVLDRQVGSEVRLVERVGRLTLEAGGKRLRPAFVTLAARATGKPFSAERAARIGACMEMIHMATLVHDDVIDHSETRRGKPTAAAEFGNTAAVLGGDVLLAKAMALLSRDGDLAIIESVANAVVAMAEGEVRELEVRGDFDLDEREHLDVLNRKTAAFIESCCEVGACLSEADLTIREALRKYGHHVGIAFQIVDDILDYNGDETKIGKPLAGDFREGQATLPLIYLRDTLSEAEAIIARSRFGNGASDDEVRMLADWMAKRGAFEKAEAAARRHVDQALEALTPLPESEAKELMVSVANYILKRES
jgi:octaprenyl-diphosphate synthase